jgi:aryl-phospho-beta-D-glucosidase BglC (GH1 family)
MNRLHVERGTVVGEKGNPVWLRGVNIGGWFNLEHIINGHPGSESNLRRVMLSTLGEGRADFFFDRLETYWFSDDDARFLADHGLNVVRLPLNYRHFERDDAPFQFLDSGFASLDRALDLCERHGLYVILDLHSVQGWQNGDWHCDNSSRHALFWQHAGFQDRLAALWKEIGTRYANRSVIAAYDLMNEPLSDAPFGRFEPDHRYQPAWALLNHVYRRLVETIREVDPTRIIVLEGDYYSTLFSGLEAPFDEHLVYSSHNYIPPATSPISSYPTTIGGALWNPAAVLRQVEESEGRRFSRAHGVPLLIGEFGVTVHDMNEETVHKPAVLADQLEAFNRLECHWTLWTYKGIGPMAWVHAGESRYAAAIAPVLRAKAELGVDLGWLGGFPADVDSHLSAVSDRILDHIPGLDRLTNFRYFSQAAMSTYTADQLQRVFASQFEDKSEAEMDDILSSFAFANCQVRSRLSEVLRRAAVWEVGP